MAQTSLGRSNLAGVLHARWSARHHEGGPPEWYPHALAASGATEDEIEAALAEAEVLSARWRRLRIGDAMTLEWY
jgi:hypothetical protein